LLLTENFWLTGPSLIFLPIFLFFFPVPVVLFFRRVNLVGLVYIKVFVGLSDFARLHTFLHFSPCALNLVRTSILVIFFTNPRWRTLSSFTSSHVGLLEPIPLDQRPTTFPFDARFSRPTRNLAQPVGSAIRFVPRCAPWFCPRPIARSLWCPQISPPGGTLPYPFYTFIRKNSDPGPAFLARPCPFGNLPFSSLRLLCLAPFKQFHLLFPSISPRSLFLWRGESFSSCIAFHS